MVSWITLPSFFPTPSSCLSEVNRWWDFQVTGCKAVSLLKFPWRILVLSFHPVVWWNFWETHWSVAVRLRKEQMQEKSWHDRHWPSKKRFTFISNDFLDFLNWLPKKPKMCRTNGFILRLEQFRESAEQETSDCPETLTRNWWHHYSFTTDLMGLQSMMPFHHLSKFYQLGYSSYLNLRHNGLISSSS